MKTRRLFPMAMAAVIATPLLAAPAAATGAVGPSVAAASPSWAAWYGCWRPMAEGMTADAPDGMVCVLPGADPASVRIVTLEDGLITDESVVRADGVARRVEEGGCVGTEQARWSSDGRRVYLRTELDCDGVKRESTGVLAMLAENVWLDAQAVSVADQHASRSIRYRAVRPEAVPAEVVALLPRRDMAQETARLHAAAPLDIDAVVEASAAVAPPVVEALLAARGHEYALDARTLIRLEEAGVPPSVLDMMIAVSYPKRFAVQPREPDRRPDRGRIAGRHYDDCLDPFYYPMLRYRADCAYLYGSRYGFGLRYGYSPWGFDRFGWGFGYSPVIIVQPGPGGEPRQRGSVVRGQGYRPGSSSEAGTAQPRSGADRSSAGSSSSTSSSSPATSTTSSGSSSSGSDSGRTARPRDP